MSSASKHGCSIRQSYQFTLLSRYVPQTASSVPTVGRRNCVSAVVLRFGSSIRIRRQRWGTRERCSSFSSLWTSGSGKPIRSRAEPMGITPIPLKWRAYLERANLIVVRSAALARAVFRGGGTYICENPHDKGARSSVHLLARASDGPSRPLARAEGASERTSLPLARPSARPLAPSERANIPSARSPVRSLAERASEHSVRSLARPLARSKGGGV